MAPKAPAPAPAAPKPPAASGKPIIEGTQHPLPDTTTSPPLTGEAARMTATAARNFEIEDNIPLPEKRIGVKGESIYPFDKIGINQSFFVGSTGTVKEPWKTLTSMASRLSRELYPKKFITARQTKDGVDGVRVWRASDATEPLAPPRKKDRKATQAPAAPQPQQEAA